MTIPNSRTDQDRADIVCQLRSIARKLEGQVGNSEPPERTGHSACNGIALRLSAYLHARRSRHKLLSRKRFSDPAWDILLDMLASDLAGRTVFVNDACIASDVPSTTALRWIRLLEVEGAIVRKADESDRRRCRLELSPRSRRELLEWLSHHLDAFPTKREAVAFSLKPSFVD